MNEERTLFILSGNNPYKSRGCEAIIGRVTKILREHFRDLYSFFFARIPNEKQFQGQYFNKVTQRPISQVTEETGMPIYLIPHITNPGSNDHAFMQRALSRIKDRNGNITLIPPKYNSAETKWIISQMAFFAGARTHSTIAALSSGVPTLSFAYSIKAQGINRDIFGHTDYCLEPTDLDGEGVASRITSMLDDSAAIRNDLAERIPGVQRAALSAGMGLKHLIGVN